MSKKKKVQIWVDPAFRQMLKEQSVIKGMPLTQLTGELAKKKKPLGGVDWQW